MNTENLNNYRLQLIATVNNLIEIEASIFTNLVNVAMSNELKDIDDVFEIGDEYGFTLEHFEKSNDQNVVKLVSLIKQLRQTVESIMNINNITESDR